MLPDHQFQQMHDPLRSSNTMDTHHIGAHFSLNESAQGKSMCSLSLYNFKKNLITVEFVHVGGSLCGAIRVSCEV
jgi:hypothetical protein